MGIGSERLKIDRDMAEEIEFHVEMRSQEFEGEGLSPEEARRKALARFGDPRTVERRLNRLRTGGRFRRLKIGALVCLALLGGIVAVVALTGNSRRVLYLVSDEYPKRAPYGAIRWTGQTPEVRVEEDWFRLVAVDQVEAEEIVEYCRETWPDIWKKRFEEDLVRALYGMGHRPRKFVTLDLEDLADDRPIHLPRVEMTEANRWEIWLAANRGEPR